MVKQTQHIGLSIMVPALNEEKNITKTVVQITSGLKGIIENYQIIIFDDGSTDNTGKIADQLAKKNHQIKVIHNKPNRGMGYCYREGIKQAKHNHYMYIPGDGLFPTSALRRMAKKIGKADIVIPYVTNMDIRPKERALLSAMFTKILNLVFSLKVKYYNGTVLHRTDLLRQLNPKADGHAYQAEILIKLIKSGATYTEIGYALLPKQIKNAGRRTSAFRWKNIKSVFKTISSLFFEIQIRRVNYHLKFD